ncbi:hypothetical protein [Saccharothrix sp. HUAS TT1]
MSELVTVTSARNDSPTTRQPDSRGDRASIGTALLDQPRTTTG